MFKVCIFVTLLAISVAKDSTPPTNVLPIASLLSHPEPQKKEICFNYNQELTQPKPHRATCNVQCDMNKSVKCTVNEYHIPECRDFGTYLFKRIFQDFKVLEKQKEFNCEVPTKDKHKVKEVRQNFKGDAKKSPLCDVYKRNSVKSAFEFPCYMKCDTYIVGISTDLEKVDWELQCDIYQQTCSSIQSTDKPVNVGFICEAFRQHVMTKVKLGEAGYHHCDVYNHGPEFDYFNRTKY